MSQTPGLGHRIAKVRQARGLLQRELAAEADVSVSFLSEVENEHRTPGAEVLLRIADALGASLDYLIRGEGGTLPEPTPVTIPPSLQAAAEKEQWSYAPTAELLRVQTRTIGRRTPQGRSDQPIRQWTKEDWIRLHEALFGQ